MNEVEAIKDALPIQEVVSRYVELKKAGINYSGLCPFHNEKTPSFYVSPDRGTYKCFGCGEGGDIYSFVEKLEGLEFRDALEKFASETGIVLSNVKSSNTNKSQKDTYYHITEHARIFWQRKLGENQKAIDYLRRRGFNKQQIIDYAIGYATPGWEDVKTFLLKKGATEQEIEQAGLIKTGDKGTTYDRFRDRIIFPLRNQTGKTVAFSGRYIGTDAVSAKYLNSPETPIFNKSKELYGLDTAKEAIRKNNFVIVVEGQVDLVMGQSVYRNTVATSGTALTSDHLNSLRRFTDRIILMFDSDQAGVNAAHKASILALGLDFEVRIGKLPDGEDPADLILRDSKQYRAHIKNSLDVFDYWINYINTRDVSEREKTKVVEERLIPLLRVHSNPLEQDRYIKHIAHDLDITEPSLRSRITQLAQNSPGVPPHSIVYEKTNVTIKKSSPMKHLVMICLWQESLAPEHQLISLDEKIYQHINEDMRSDFDLLLEEMRTKELDMHFFEFEKMYKSSIMLENDISELITNMSTYRLKQRQEELTKLHHVAKRNGNDKEAQRLLQEIQKIVSRHA